MLIRALQLIYLSDENAYIDNVIITGFYEYFDRSFGTDRRKDVIMLNMIREDFAQTDFNRIDINALFESRLHPKESKGMYSKNAIDIAELK